MKEGDKEKSQVSRIIPDLWKPELERTSSRFHYTVAWVAIILNPVFALTDYYNIPHAWKTLLVMRLIVSGITLLTVLLRTRLRIPSFVIAVVPFLLISLQNAYVYYVVDLENLMGQNLNYMALLIGAGMFVLWRWEYSLGIILVSGVATYLFLHFNPLITANQFFVNGGLLLMAVAIFMGFLIHTKYRLTIRGIKTRLALKMSNENIQRQAEEISNINNNLEKLVKERTHELQEKNEALRQAAFVNAHELRGPLASILGLIDLLETMPVTEESKPVLSHLRESADKLDATIQSVTHRINDTSKKK